LQAIVAGLQQSVRDFKESVTGVAAHDVLELMLVTQYFDMLREVGANAKTSTVFTPGPSEGGAGGSAAELIGDMRRSMLEAGCVQSMSRA
jgi:hypothetical protein